MVRKSTVLFLLCVALKCSGVAQDDAKNLPSGKSLAHVPGDLQATNTLPTVLAVSPDYRYVAVLNNGYGSYTSDQKQSVAILEVGTGKLTDFPEDRMKSGSLQSFFHGLAFSTDGSRLYASVGSMTDPLGEKNEGTGNGILVYSFSEGKVAFEKFLKMTPRVHAGTARWQRPDMVSVTYPAALSAIRGPDGDLLLVANNLSDEAVLMKASGEVVKRFDLALFKRMPSSLPFGVVATRDGKTAFVSLWNGSRVAELDLTKGTLRRMIPLAAPKSNIAPGSHPTAMLLSPDDKELYVTLSNADEVVAVDRTSARVVRRLSTKLPGQRYGGSAPNALALAPDGMRLYVANAISDSVSVFDLRKPATGEPVQAIGFVPTQIFPTALAAVGGDLLIASGKGAGTGPIDKATGKQPNGVPEYPYLVPMMHGSIARIRLADIEENLATYTEQVLASNRMGGNADKVEFASGKNPIKHVIYILKENRTYDQILGDLGIGNGDPSLTMYGESVTPNEHKLARQFGVLDNFYDSGDVSGDGHMWSTAATVTDYTEKTWPIDYRSHERTYDYQGQVLSEIPLEDENPDVNEPDTGYLWTNFARHGISYRDYGEFVVSKWCNAKGGTNLPTQGPPHPEGDPCPKGYVTAGEELPANVGDPHGAPSPYAWPIPILSRNIATKLELRGHFDPRFPEFETSYPDQLRADEFLNEFAGFVSDRQKGKDTLPQFILLYLPDDHTGELKKGYPTPSASVADNDLAVGRVVDAVSHSAFWDDTAIFIVEDDAQDGPDHVDAHRSIAFVISKYSPRRELDRLEPSVRHTFLPYVEHTFYTTVNMLHTMESLLGAPPMNNNDAHAAVMSGMFSGNGDEPPFECDYKNRDNKLIYQVNPRDYDQGAKLDYSRPDAIDAGLLNRLLWEERWGERPMPAPKHSTLFGGMRSGWFGDGARNLEKIEKDPE
jgi:DNA-binding beta-propeller fold protein YncE